ncbi:DUF1858 domain-containing protein [Anaeromicropila herbilytica]|uniref:Disulfide oxidoreductase n=1 Tax=Anaeromicropila herbilytica TaxID=2785025 RepID=A0A7R7EJ02_9FIRM|nr:DUF1858 domain-containing protein [Anaeromicropila herbilytica]BCN29312.1 disulfide oxidoreductase [Anaeromicropila herbilytica]
MQVTKETIIGDMINENRGTAAILMEAGMHCVMCPSAQGESIEEAAMVHGIEADALVQEINNYLISQ